MDGFQLLDLHDYPGQGTAIVGPLNVFWESKGYITPEEWKKFCDVTVPLARLYKRIYTEGETLEVPIEIAHFGSKPIEGAQAEWWITNAAGETMTAGELELRTVELATAQPLGEVSVALADFAAPAKYELHVGLKGRADVENDWEFWVYPESVDTAAAGDVLMTRSFGEAWAKLAEGGDVLLMPRFDQLAWDSPPVGRLPIFWNRLMGPRWERFLGLVCDPGHPALAKFATDRHYDWQWQDVLIPYCRGINMDGLPGELQPIVQLIDDWNRNDKLGLVFEARVGEGRLLMCAANLETDLEERPAARQLLSSLQAYVASDEFAPEIAVTEEQLMSLRQDNGLMMRLVEAAVADASIEGNEAEKAIDGDPNTYWFTTRHRDRVDYPHELTLRFNRQVAMRGVILMNRQNERAHTGDIREYELQVSDDGDAWETVLAGELPSKFDPQEFLFDKAVTARHLRLRGLSGYGADHTAGLAEIAIVPGGRVGDTEVDGGHAWVSQHRNFDGRDGRGPVEIELPGAHRLRAIPFHSLKRHSGLIAAGGFGAGLVVAAAAVEGVEPGMGRGDDDVSGDADAADAFAVDIERDLDAALGVLALGDGLDTIFQQTNMVIDRGFERAVESVDLAVRPRMRWPRVRRPLGP